MLSTMQLKQHNFDPEYPWRDPLAAISWAIRSTVHSTTGATPGELVFGRHMIHDIIHIADWENIRIKKD